MQPNERQLQLLTLLSACGGKVNNLDFQKLLFLYCHEVELRSPYEFVPYKYGAFSFSSYADRRKLTERGFLAKDEHSWQITDTGNLAILPVAKTATLDSFIGRYSALRGDDLVAETYRRFPYYAIRSEIAGRILRTDPEALKRIKSARPKTGTKSVSTIGYEGRSLESYLNELIRSGVTLLCDVRRNPISRKYGFSKSTLSNACEGVGIRYAHMPELGIASDRRQTLETQADYDKLFAEYKRKDLPEQKAAIEQLRGWVDSGEIIALTCYERLPEQCHRHCVADALERRFGPEFVAQNL